MTQGEKHKQNSMTPKEKNIAHKGMHIKTNYVKFCLHSQLA
jgi:hypothetical protein